MRRGPAQAIVRILDQRAPVVEPLAVIAIVSLVTTWMLQPFLVQALAGQGTVAQGAAQAALWLSGVLSPITAFVKAAAAALVCWSCAAFLGERLPIVKLLSAFCMAETLFSLRDVALIGVLVSRGIAAVRTSTDLLVAFGVNAFVHAPSPLQRIGIESWDVFGVAWAVAIFWMLRTVFKADRRSSAMLAAVVFAFRALFSAAGLLYTI